MRLPETFTALQDAVSAFQGAVSEAKTVAGDHDNPPQPVGEAVEASSVVEDLIAERVRPNTDAAAWAAAEGALDKCRVALIDVHDGVLDIGEIYQEGISTFELGTALYRSSHQRRDPDVRIWADSTRQGFANLVAPFNQMQRAVNNCWAELSQSLVHQAGPLPAEAQQDQYPPSEGKPPRPPEPTIFEVGIAGLEATDNAIRIASGAFSEAGLPDVADNLDEASAEIAPQLSYSKSASKSAQAIPDYDNTFGHQLRSFFAGVASRMSGTLALATDRLDEFEPPPSESARYTLLLTIQTARDAALAGAEKIDEFFGGGRGAS